MIEMAQPRYSAEETVRRGQELYERDIRPAVEAENIGKYIVIDIETGEYEIGTDYHAVARQMLAKKPNAALSVLRIGYPAVGRIGSRVRGLSLSYHSTWSFHPGTGNDNPSTLGSCGTTSFPPHRRDM
jgi:hypothetical protein